MKVLPGHKWFKKERKGLCLLPTIKHSQQKNIKCPFALLNNSKNNGQWCSKSENKCSLEMYDKLVDTKDAQELAMNKMSITYCAK